MVKKIGRKKSSKGNLEIKSLTSSKRVCQYIVLVFIVCFILFGILEIFLRVYTKPLNMRIKGEKIILPVGGRQYTTYLDDETGKVDKVVFYKQNSIGFRGEEPPEDFSKYFTFFAIGGSTTFNAFISDGKTWVDVLGMNLKHVFKDTWINNAGFNGMSTKGNISIMRWHISKMKPKVVLHLVGINDRVDPSNIGIDAGRRQRRADALLARQKDYINRAKVFMNRITRRSLERISSYSEVVAFALNVHRNYIAYKYKLTNRIMNFNDVERIEISENDKEEIRRRMSNANIKEHLIAYEKRLIQLIEMAKDISADTVFITSPAMFGNAVDDITKTNLAKAKVYPELVLNGDLWWEFTEIVNDVTRKVAEENNILLIDLARELPVSSEYYIDWIHYSIKGNKKVAEIIYKELCPYLATKYNEYVIGKCNS